VKPWFNLNETDRTTYEQSKLKRFLTQQRFVMEDTLLKMTEKSVHRFVDSICSFLPIACLVNAPNDVSNTYYTAEQIKALGAPKPKFPLFVIELQLDEDNRPSFSHSPSDVVHSILKTFDHGLAALQEIGQLEQKLLPTLFKSNQKSFLKVPVKPDTMPDSPDPNDKKQLPDPNTWIYVAYQKLRSRIAECVDPLDAYLKTFDKFNAEYKLDPEAVIKQFDNPEDPKDSGELRGAVIANRRQADALLETIPESITVSMFTVNCDNIRKMLVAKHTQIADALVEVIAKQAKAQAFETMKEFTDINDMINRSPNDIEELSAIREFVAGVPNQIEKLEGQIKMGMQTYSILEEFGYKFGEDDDYDKQWKLYGSPCETHEVIKLQRDKLEKEEHKMVNKMQQEQSEFD